MAAQAAQSAMAAAMQDHLNEEEDDVPGQMQSSSSRAVEPKSPGRKKKAPASGRTTKKTKASGKKASGGSSSSKSTTASSTTRVGNASKLAIAQLNAAQEDSKDRIARKRQELLAKAEKKSADAERVAKKRRELLEKKHLREAEARAHSTGSGLTSSGTLSAEAVAEAKRKAQTQDEMRDIFSSAGLDHIYKEITAGSTDFDYDSNNASNLSGDVAAGAVIGAPSGHGAGSSNAIADYYAEKRQERTVRSAHNTTGSDINFPATDPTAAVKFDDDWWKSLETAAGLGGEAMQDAAAPGGSLSSKSPNPAGGDPGGDSNEWLDKLLDEAADSKSSSSGAAAANNFDQINRDVASASASKSRSVDYSVLSEPRGGLHDGIAAMNSTNSAASYHTALSRTPSISSLGGNMAGMDCGLSSMSSAASAIRGGFSSNPMINKQLASRPQSTPLIQPPGGSPSLRSEIPSSVQSNRNSINDDIDDLNRRLLMNDRNYDPMASFAFPVRAAAERATQAALSKVPALRGKERQLLVSFAQKFEKSWQAMQRKAENGGAGALDLSKGIPVGVPKADNLRASGADGSVGPGGLIGAPGSGMVSPASSGGAKGAGKGGLAPVHSGAPSLSGMSVGSTGMRSQSQGKPISPDQERFMASQKSNRVRNDRRGGNGSPGNAARPAPLPKAARSALNLLPPPPPKRSRTNSNVTNSNGSPNMSPSHLEPAAKRPRISDPMQNVDQDEGAPGMKPAPFVDVDPTVAALDALFSEGSVGSGGGAGPSGVADGSVSRASASRSISEVREVHQRSRSRAMSHAGSLLIDGEDE